MYTVIGADGMEYGPVDAAQIRQWIAEHRLNAQSKIRVEGSGEWCTLSELPEFTDALAAATATVPPPYSSIGEPGVRPETLAADYNLDIGACISGGFNLLQNNLGLLLCAVLIYWGIELGIALLGIIPFFGTLVSLANIFIVGPMLGGVYYVFLKAIRRQATSVSEVFIGFRTRYWQLFLGNIIPGLLAALCMVPLGVVLCLVSAHMLMHGPSAVHLAILIGTGLVCFIPMIYLQINWLFTLPLIIDRQLSFWSAMKASWKMVTKHWWTVFGLSVLALLILAAGLLLCGIGVLFTMPISIGAYLYAYETIFNPAPAQAQGM